MKVTVKVGDVSVTVDGLDLTKRGIRSLLMDCAGIAASLQPEVEQASPVGFTAHLERLPDELAPEPYYEDEDV